MGSTFIRLQEGIAPTQGIPYRPRDLRRTRPTKTAILSLMSVAAAALCAPRAQAQMTTITGIVSTGTDRTGVFGLAPGSSLAGKEFSLTYTIDTAEEQYTYYTNTNVPWTCEVTGQGKTNASSPVIADLTINGHTYSFGSLPISYVQSTASRTVNGVPGAYFNNNRVPITFPAMKALGNWFSSRLFQIRRLRIAI